MHIKKVEIENCNELIEVMKDVEMSGNMLFSPGERRIEENSFKAFLMNINNQDKSGFFIATDQGILHGYIMVKSETQQRTSHRASLVMGVHSSSRGRGVGKALLEYSIRWAKNIGLQRLELTVLENNERAIHLYEKVGFEREGIRKNALLINDRYMNELYMAYLL